MLSTRWRHCFSSLPTSFGLKTETTKLKSKRKRQSSSVLWSRRYKTKRVHCTTNARLQQEYKQSTHTNTRARNRISNLTHTANKHTQKLWLSNDSTTAITRPKFLTLQTSSNVYDTTAIQNNLSANRMVSVASSYSSSFDLLAQTHCGTKLV